MNWATFWPYVTWAAIITYFVLGAILIVGGFFDVIKMFRRLEAEHAAHCENQRQDRRRQNGLSDD